MDIEITHLSYRYKEEGKPVLHDINLHIDKGEWLMISGGSGSGKTTLAYAIAGILFHQEMGIYQGNVRIGNKSIEETQLYEIADAVGFVQQNADDQFCTLNTADELAFGLENRRVPPDEMRRRISASLKITKAEELNQRNLFELSGGEKQKIAIASILALNPMVLILDEPTSNLDQNSTRAIFNVLNDLRKTRKLTVIIIEHRIQYFKDLFKRCVHLENGEIVFDGKVEESPFYTIPEKHSIRESSLESDRKEPSLTLHNWNYENGDGFKLEIGDLEIKQGEIIALMGENGSGKTTFLKTLLGILKCKQGKMEFREKKSTGPVRFGYVFQNADEQIFMNSVKDEIAYGLKNYHLDDALHQARSRELLELFGLQNRENENPHQLSYGEKKRLNLISTLIFSPSILLLDEIFIGQDIFQVNYILRKLMQLRKIGVTIIAAIHDPALMKQMADRILFIEDGSLRFCLPTQQAVIWWQVNGYRDFLPEKESGA